VHNLTTPADRIRFLLGGDAQALTDPEAHETAAAVIRLARDLETAMTHAPRTRRRGRRRCSTTSSHTNDRKTA
jgi:hypothetical protein